MNLFKKAHSEFMRMGGSLESKYDKTMDNHYIALNLGEATCGFLANIKAFIGGTKQTELFADIA